MTDDTDTIDKPVEAPKKVIKKRRKPQRRAAVAASPTPKVPAEFAGLNAKECCNACNKDGCVISGSIYCAHPFKGGLQTTEMNDPDALKRFNRAKAALKDQQIDLTLR